MLERRARRAWVILSSAIIGTGLSAAAAAAAAAPGDVAAKAWILVDADSGQVLGGRAHHEALPPASTTKLMTALMAVERLPGDATVVVGDRAAAQPAMRIGMQTGQSWTRSDALHSLLMVSANDAAYAIAEAVSGDVGAFAADTNATAARYGMKDSVFNDPAGFDDSASFNGGSRVSAYDLAVAARNFLAVPELAAIAPLPEYRFTGPLREHRLLNHNKLLRRYEGAIGLKTGYTRQAGHTFVGAARRDGRTMIAVVLDADDIYGGSGSLLDRGFATAPGAPGTGEHLPAVRVRTYRPPVEEATADAPREAADASGSTDDGGGWLRLIAAAVVALGVSVLALRRRAERRRRLAAERRRRRAETRARERLRSADPDGWDAGCRTGLRHYETI